jgi:hypothetical protein
MNNEKPCMLALSRMRRLLGFLVLGAFFLTCSSVAK